MFRLEHCAECSSWNIEAVWRLYVQSVPTGTLKQFCWNTVEISENSENHLKAIVGWREVAGVDGVSDRGGKVVGKTQSEGKASKNGERGWQSRGGSANYIELGNIWETSRLSPDFPSVPRFPRLIRLLSFGENR